MRINLLILFTLFTFFCFSNLSAQKQKDSIKVCPVEISATYVGDVVGNTTGGITTGVNYLGAANLSISLETEKANWWNGGQFYVKGGNTHGSSPSSELIGDFQIVSNIDGGGNHTYLFECWYKQQIGNVKLTLGLQDMNAEFANSDNASYYINSSFGIPSTIPENVPSPIFPITAIGLSVNWDINENFSWKNIIYSGEIYDFDYNEYNIKWNLNPNDGILAVTEFNYSSNQKYNCTYKIGSYYYNKPKKTGAYNYGFYFMGDQNIGQWAENKRLDLFVQTAVNPTKSSYHKYYIGGGVNFYGLGDKRGENCLGLGVAHAGFKNMPFKHETVIEAFYKTNFLNHFYVQPDIQYIISPVGREFTSKNALAIILRCGIEI